MGNEPDSRWCFLHWYQNGFGSSVPGYPARRCGSWGNKQWRWQWWQRWSSPRLQERWQYWCARCLGNRHGHEGWFRNSGLRASRKHRREWLSRLHQGLLRLCSRIIICISDRILRFALQFQRDMTMTHSCQDGQVWPPRVTNISQFSVREICKNKISWGLPKFWMKPPFGRNNEARIIQVARASRAPRVTEIIQIFGNCHSTGRASKCALS